MMGLTWGKGYRAWFVFFSLLVVPWFCVAQPDSEGAPERGRFQFLYSYQGQSIDAVITIRRNGEKIAGVSGMQPVSNEVLVDTPIEKGDVLTVTSAFRGDSNSGTLTAVMFGHPQGLWYSYGSGSFYSVDPNGDVLEVFGNWSFGYSLTPPWNGIDITAEPLTLVAGEASDITLQPYETPAEPVILPDQTYINLQTNLLGDLIGGLGLPEYGFRYTQGFTNAPWGLLKDTEILYEVHPSIEASDPLQIPVYAYSPYDFSTLGLTVIEVGEEEELNLTLELSGQDKAWPTLERSDVQHRFDLDTIDNIIEGIIVTVTKSNGEPTSDQTVEIEALWVTDSGGHSHTNAPPKDKMGVLSVFLDPPLAPKEGKGVVTAKTDENGKIYLNYTTPKFGGEIDLKATLQTDNEQQDSQRITARVPGMMAMPEFEYYTKIGGTRACGQSACGAPLGRLNASPRCFPYSMPPHRTAKSALICIKSPSNSHTQSNCPHALANIMGPRFTVLKTTIIG